MLFLMRASVTIPNSSSSYSITSSSRISLLNSTTISSKISTVPESASPASLIKCVNKTLANVMNKSKGGLLKYASNSVFKTLRAPSLLSSIFNRTLFKISSFAPLPLQTTIETTFGFLNLYSPYF